MSTKKSINLPATWSITLGSAWVIGVPESGQLQSSSKVSSWRVGSGLGVTLGRSGPLPSGVRTREAEGQSLAQCPCCLHFGQGFVCSLGLGHVLAQCPSLPHLKQAPGGGFCGPEPVAGRRAATRAWVCWLRRLAWSSAFCFSLALWLASAVSSQAL